MYRGDNVIVEEDYVSKKEKKATKKPRENEKKGLKKIDIAA